MSKEWKTCDRSLTVFTGALGESCMGANHDGSVCFLYSGRISTMKVKSYYGLIIL